MKNQKENISTGLLLEKSQKMIPWKIAIEELENYGAPEIIKQSERRADYVWRNEQILKGIKTDVTVMSWDSFFRKRFTHAYGLLSQQDFRDSKMLLEQKFGMEGKYKKLNDLENIHGKFKTYKFLCQKRIGLENITKLTLDIRNQYSDCNLLGIDNEVFKVKMWIKGNRIGKQHLFSMDSELLRIDTTKTKI